MGQNWDPRIAVLFWPKLGKLIPKIRKLNSQNSRSRRLNHLFPTKVHGYLKGAAYQGEGDCDRHDQCTDGLICYPKR